MHLLLPPFASTLPPAPNPSTCVVRPHFLSVLIYPYGPSPSICNSPNAKAEYRLLKDLPDFNMDIKLVLTNLSASVPLSTPHMSCNLAPPPHSFNRELLILTVGVDVNSALIQPIVLYLNTNYTELPLAFRCVIPQVCLNSHSLLSRD